MSEKDSADAARAPLSRLLYRGITKGCPVCGARRHFRWWVNMNEACHRCGFRFERIEGHWVGAIGINTIATFGILLIGLMVSLFVTFPDFPVVPLMIGNAALALVFPILFFPISRTLWTAIDVAMRPLEPHEVERHGNLDVGETRPIDTSNPSTQTRDQTKNNKAN